VKDHEDWSSTLQLEENGSTTRTQETGQHMEKNSRGSHRWDLSAAAVIKSAQEDTEGDDNAAGWSSRFFL